MKMWRALASILPAAWAMRAPHTCAALAALLLACSGLSVACLSLQDSRVHRPAPALAALQNPETFHSHALCQEIFTTPAALPVFGSSELANEQPTRADHFFLGAPGGFQPYLMGRAGDRCLVMLQELGGSGAAAVGRRAVIFLSPTWFIHSQAGKLHHVHRQFSQEFSPLFTGEFFTNELLTPDLRRDVATRLLAYAEVIHDHSPLLSAELHLTQGRPRWKRALANLLHPLITWQDGLWQLQDDVQLWLDLRRHGSAVAAAARPYRARGKLDWPELAQRADASAEKYGANFFSVHSRAPALLAAIPARSRAELRVFREPDTDPAFLRRMAASSEWRDFDLLLRTIRQMHIHALIINQPINGLVSDRQGVTAAARAVYYARVREMAQARGVPLEDFAAFEHDRAFFADVVHPSAKAWIYYDRALTDWYHGNGKRG